MTGAEAVELFAAVLFVIVCVVKRYVVDVEP